jgi:hyperosmotically inducible protein
MRSDGLRYFAACAALLAATCGSSQAQARGGQGGAGAATAQSRVAEEARHRLLLLPYYDVFDWIEGQVEADGTLTLRGQVVRPTTKSDAEAGVRDVDGVTRVDNRIEVLPPSPGDDRLRQRLYRSIYSFDSPLFRYGQRAVPPIHIIVNRGRVTLKGVVASSADSRIAYARARTVPGSFAVDNQLIVENERIR